MSSLWEVDDRATQMLMEKFYTHWVEGMSQAEALQQAQIQMWEEYPNPYYWAAFSLSGDPGEVAGSKNDEAIETLMPTQTQTSDPVTIPNCTAGISLLGFFLVVITRSPKGLHDE